MNEACEARTCLVVYPGQTGAANHQRCWNWFNRADQARDRGEPSILAGITHDVMSRYAVDPRRVYVAGLSAGGAAAAVMSHVYSDIYAAAGIHSGLACGAATDVGSAFGAMRDGAPGIARRGDRPIPTIVFHGDRDTTVNPVNGDAVIGQAMPAAKLVRRVWNGGGNGVHPYSVTEYRDSRGCTVLEQWVVHGGGHAWSGGSPAGSFTDPRGPDATEQMLRFFLQHEHPAA